MKGLVLGMPTANTRRYVVFIAPTNQNMADPFTLNLEEPDSYVYTSRDPKRTLAQILPSICPFHPHYSSQTHLYNTCQSCSSSSSSIYLLRTCFHAHTVIDRQFLLVAKFPLLDVCLTRTLCNLCDRSEESFVFRSIRVTFGVG